MIASAKRIILFFFFVPSAMQNYPSLEYIVKHELSSMNYCCCFIAYVCGEKEGNILESPFYMGDTLKGTSKLDINAEKELVKEYLDRLRVQGATNEAIISTMKDFGIERFLRI